MNDQDLVIILVISVFAVGSYLWSVRQRNRPRTHRPDPEPSQKSLRPAQTVPPPKPPTPNAPLPIPPALPDPNDPLVRRCVEVAALVEPMFAAIDALPKTLREQVAMRAVAMAAQNELSKLRRRLPVSNFGARSVLFRELDELAQQFAGLHASAQIIAGNYASYAQLIGQLRTDAPLLRQDLDALAQEAAYPLAWPRTGPISLAGDPDDHAPGAARAAQQRRRSKRTVSSCPWPAEGY